MVMIEYSCWVDLVDSLPHELFSPSWRRQPEGPMSAASTKERIRGLATLNVPYGIAFHWTFVSI